MIKLKYNKITAKSAVTICFNIESKYACILVHLIHDHNTKEKTIIIPEWLAIEKGLEDYGEAEE